MSAVLRAGDLPARLDVGEASIEVSFDSDPFDLGQAALLDWVMQSARAATSYFGRFPVTHARVHLVLSRGGRISTGVSFRDGGARCRITVGQHVTLADLDDDWVLAHEMIHFGFPSVEERHHWIEEGIATYVEPIARAQVGRLTPERVWREMVDGMPQGLPATGDQGLDNTHTWGRTYWGSALFCLLADIEIRKQTGMPKVSRMRCGPSTARAGRLRPTGRLSVSSRSATKRRMVKCWSSFIARWLRSLFPWICSICGSNWA